MFLFFHDSICAMCTFSSSTNNFSHAQALSRMSSLSGRMNIARVNIGFFTGFKKIKQRPISFVLGYLRMILWKISTAISIKHRILATFNVKKINSDSMYAFKEVDIKKWELYTVVSPVISWLLCNAIWNSQEIYLYLILKRSFKM